MKEATGELNMTVITVVAIAAVAAFFYAFVWPSIKNNISNTQRCSASVDCNCGEGGTDASCNCHYYEDNGAISTNTITCPNPSRNTQ